MTSTNTGTLRYSSTPWRCCSEFGVLPRRIAANLMALARNQWLKILWNVLTYGATDSSVNRRGPWPHKFRVQPYQDAWLICGCPYLPGIAVLAPFPRGRPSVTSLPPPPPSFLAPKGTLRGGHHLASPVFSHDSHRTVPAHPTTSHRIAP